MIKVIPSMPIKGGKVVKPIKGDIDQVTIYDKNPLDLAHEFEDHGFQRLHLVDLDGAIKRTVVNFRILEMLTKYTKLQIDYSGGVTSDGDIRTLFESGAKWVTVASVAVHQKEKFKSWLISYGGEKIILAADSQDGIVLTGGWKRQTGIDLYEHLDYYHERGVRYVKATEIARDGTLLGPHFELYRNMVTKFPDLKIFACGGIRSAEDIDELEKIGVYGIIFSKAFYEGLVKLEDLTRFVST